MVYIQNFSFKNRDFWGDIPRNSEPGGGARLRLPPGGDVHDPRFLSPCIASCHAEMFKFSEIPYLSSRAGVLYFLVPAVSVFGA